VTADTAAAGMKKGQWAALIAAFLGWMFDGFEIGLFPLVAQPALKDMLPGAPENEIGNWIGVMTAAFLVGAATGGVVFGWLGDRLGRVRAMALSILTYAVFSGLCGIVTAPWQLFLFRFLASLGMGGEWSLGVSLVMEIWPNKSRAWLAGAIGAAANVGFVLVAVLGLVLSQLLDTVGGWLLATGLAEETVARLTSNSGWRLLAISGALPALLTFIVRVFVPESEKWLEEHEKGSTKQWSTGDLLAVVVGCAAALGLVSLWALDDWFRQPGLADAEQFSLPLSVRIGGTVVGLLVAYWGYTYPIRRYLQRSLAVADAPQTVWTPPRVLGRMLLGATLSGVALLGTWASLQNAAPWAGKLEESRVMGDAAYASPEAAKPAAQAAAAKARSYTQIASGIAAIIFTLIAALAGDWFGRRVSYFLLCLTALGSSLLFFQSNHAFDMKFLATVFLAGGLTASFYGWLPLYLPELFPTRVRAFGQGFAFNFGRILAAIGALQFSYMMKNIFEGSYPKACTVLSFIYVIGMVVIWLAPETKGEPLPE
jgi:SHS family sialic acid transporter-like MFS transporter